MRWRFIHIPKCGGITFRSAYADYERALQPTCNTIDCIPPDVRTVAVIRHPLDRLVSICSFYFGSTAKLDQWLDSGDWLDRPVFEVEGRPPLRYPSTKLTIPWSTPQVNWIREETHLILLDDYQRGVDEWADIAGFPRRRLEVTNTSNRAADWREYLSPEHVEQFSEFYAEDLATYGRLLVAAGCKG